ncbi:MAG TPA: chorismate synthase [Firmicutes bacterium]|nr:chorismate synthase [Bacillota bacterium]
MRYLSAGESHGPALVGIIEGLPAGLKIEEDYINRQLSRRQGGYGRGGRMSIEKDSIIILSGVRFGKTTGAPLALEIENRDWVNWQKVMSKNAQDETSEKRITSPRPGHADLAGGIKYFQRDLRNVLERASARETAMRVAVGSIASLLLKYFHIESAGYVVAVGDIKVSPKSRQSSVNEIKEKTAASLLYCTDAETEKLMLEKIDRARESGDTLGGVFEILVEGVPPGLGSHVHWDRRLDGRLAGALMSIPGIKGVEIGLGFSAAENFGSLVHDAIVFNENKEIARSANHAGGLEGGITNGEPLLLRAAMKPIPTLMKALPSIDLATGEQRNAAIERSDICAVAAASVVGEAVVAWEIARAFLEKFSGDTMIELEQAYHYYMELVQRYLKNK